MNPASENSKLLRLHQVIETTGLARSTIYKMIALRQFPAPLKLTRKTVAWPSTEIDGWIASRTRSQ